MAAPRTLTFVTGNAKKLEEFRRILVDDVRRRHYVIDADVERQTMELMTCPPSPDQEGRVGEVSHGGMRRIDRILVRHGSGTGQTTGYGFISALAGATDHVPVVATVSVNNQ